MAKSIYFRETQIEEIIRRMINKPYGFIYDYELFDINELCIQNTDIKSLRGVESLKNLKILKAAFCSIDSLKELENLSALEELYLDNNRIYDIRPLHNLTNLKRLSLGGNRIRHITALNKLRKLEYLKIDNNDIADMSIIKYLPNISELIAANGSRSRVLLPLTTFQKGSTPSSLGGSASILLKQTSAGVQIPL